MKTNLISALAMSAALVIGTAAPVFAQSATGTDCPAGATTADSTGVDPAGKAKMPGADEPCQPAAGSAGASGSDSSSQTGSVTSDGQSGNGDNPGNGSGGNDGNN